MMTFFNKAHICKWSLVTLCKSSPNLESVSFEFRSSTVAATPRLAKNHRLCYPDFVGARLKEKSANISHAKFWGHNMPQTRALDIRNLEIMLKQISDIWKFCSVESNLKVLHVWTKSEFYETISSDFKNWFEDKVHFSMWIEEILRYRTRAIRSDLEESIHWTWIDALRTSCVSQTSCRCFWAIYWHCVFISKSNRSEKVVFRMMKLIQLYMEKNEMFRYESRSSKIR
jgi:hypothetical protein